MSKVGQTEWTNTARVGGGHRGVTEIVRSLESTRITPVESELRERPGLNLEHSDIKLHP